MALCPWLLVHVVGIQEWCSRMRCICRSREWTVLYTMLNNFLSSCAVSACLSSYTPPPLASSPGKLIFLRPWLFHTPPRAPRVFVSRYKTPTKINQTPSPPVSLRPTPPPPLPLCHFGCWSHSSPPSEHPAPLRSTRFQAAVIAQQSVWQ